MTRVLTNISCLSPCSFELNTIVAQSICTQSSSSSGRPDIALGSGTLKKGPKYGLFATHILDLLFTNQAWFRWPSSLERESECPEVRL